MMSNKNLSESSPNEVELAIPVAQRVSLEVILLVDCKATRTPDADLDENSVSIDISIEGIETEADRENKRISVRPTFELSATKKSDAKVLVLVKAQFVLLYSIDSFDGIEDKNVAAFASTNGLFNAWPYWREFVQNTFSRMGLKQLTIPVFRL